jgi:hypothetical protein
MRKRHPNHCLVKGRRNYTVAEIARLFGLRKNTVRQWIKTGLPVIDDKRPILGPRGGSHLLPSGTSGRKEAALPAWADVLCAMPCSEIPRSLHG